MPHSSKKLRDADTLADKYQTSFGGKYSPENKSPSLSSKKIKMLWNLIVLSRLRLGVLMVICFLLVTLTLIKTKASFIMSRPKSILEDSKIDYTKLFKYSSILSIGGFIVIFGLSYKVPLIKGMLFKEEDCDLCLS
jgi:hypothetical protein